MLRVLNSIKAAVLPQPRVLDRETVERQTLLRSIFMQGELGAAGDPDWKVAAEVELMKHQSQGVTA